MSTVAATEGAAVLPPDQPGEQRARYISSALPLALAYAGLIVYATLYPFGPWRMPGGTWAEWLTLPQPRSVYRFDVVANFFGYLPFAALLAIAALRMGRSLWLTVALGAAVPSALSYLLECAQLFVPGRFSSIHDWRLNTAGALAGAALAVALDAGRWIGRWSTLRDRWFTPDSGPTLALLSIWPFGLLFPAPLPLAMGPSGERVRQALFEHFDDVPWLIRMIDVWMENQPALRTDLPMLQPLAMTLGLLAPALLAASIMRPGWRRVAMAAAAVVVGCATTTLSTALNFAPETAWSWVELEPLAQAVALTLVSMAVCMWVPMRLAALVGLVAVLAMMALVAEFRVDPYYALSLQAWEQGRFVSFHGLAQWIGWLWPVAAAVALIGRLAGAPGTVERPA